MATVISDCADGIGTTELRDAVAPFRVVQSCRCLPSPLAKAVAASSPSIDRTCKDDPQEEVSREMDPFCRTEYERRTRHLPRRAPAVFAARFCSERCASAGEFFYISKLVSTPIKAEGVTRDMRVERG